MQKAIRNSAVVLSILFQIGPVISFRHLLHGVIEKPINLLHHISVSDLSRPGQCHEISHRLPCNVFVQDTGHSASLLYVGALIYSRN